MKVSETAYEKAQALAKEERKTILKRQEEERKFDLCVSHNICPECGGQLKREVRQIHWTTTLWIKRYYRAAFVKCTDCGFELNKTSYYL